MPDWMMSVGGDVVDDVNGVDDDRGEVLGEVVGERA